MVDRPWRYISIDFNFVFHLIPGVEDEMVSGSVDKTAILWKQEEDQVRTCNCFSFIFIFLFCYAEILVSYLGQFLILAYRLQVSFCDRPHVPV